jgi:hypothetical protein
MLQQMQDRRVTARQAFSNFSHASSVCLPQLALSSLRRLESLVSVNWHQGDTGLEINSDTIVTHGSLRCLVHEWAETIQDNGILQIPRRWDCGIMVGQLRDLKGLTSVGSLGVFSTPPS